MPKFKMDNVIKQPVNHSGSLVSAEDTIYYCKMPDGTLMEWGTITVDIPANSYVEHTIDFNPDFVGSVPSITATVLLYSDPKAFSVIARSTGGYTAVLRIGTTSSVLQEDVKVNWFAVGRWK